MARKLYSPPVNPLAKTILVRPHVTRRGRFVKSYFRRPKYRTRIA